MLKHYLSVSLLIVTAMRGPWLQMAPARGTFVAKLRPSPGGDVMQEMLGCTQAFSPVLAAVHKYLIDNGLDDPARV